MKRVCASSRRDKERSDGRKGALCYKETVPSLSFFFYIFLPFMLNAYKIYLFYYINILLMRFAPKFCLKKTKYFSFPLIPDDFDQNALPSSSVELAVENLLPRSEIKMASGDRYNHFPPHNGSLEVCVAVVLTGQIVAVP